MRKQRQNRVSQIIVCNNHIQECERRQTVFFGSARTGSQGPILCEALCVQNSLHVGFLAVFPTTGCEAF